jgi:hypothetical protein
MDPKELRGLYEAYAEVYAPQEELDEASRRDEFTRAAIARNSGRKGGITFEPGPNWDPSANRGRGAHLNPKQKEKQRRKALRQEELDIFDIVLEFLQAEGFVETLEEAEWMMANVIDEEAIGIILGEEQLDELSVNKMLAYVEKGEKNRADLNKKWDKGTATHRERMRVLGREEGEKRASDKVEKKTGKRPYQMNALDKVRYAVTKEDYMDEAQEARNNPEKYEREQSKKSAPVRGERTPMPPRGDKRREDFEKWYAKQMGR